MMKKKLFFIIASSFAITSHAGVMPSQSRIIYESQAKDKSLMLANTNDYPVIVQTWIDKGEGTPNSADIPFISIPPVFRLDASGVKGIRVIYNQKHLPGDKESLFWFNIYEIPPEKKKVSADKSVLVTMNTQIKLFYRPSSITITAENAIKELTCRQQSNNTLHCLNPTPIYLSIIGVRLKGTNGSNQDTISNELMIAPLSHALYQFRDGKLLSGVLILHYIDDNGNQQTYISPKKISATTPDN